MIQTITRTTSPVVQTLLPSVLIAYLWELADGEQTARTQSFLLTRQVLGGRPLQEVRHVAHGQTMAVHKVFGFQPVNACILITGGQNGLRMEDGSLLEAVGPVSACG